MPVTDKPHHNLALFYRMQNLARDLVAAVENTEAGVSFEEQNHLIEALGQFRERCEVLSEQYKESSEA